ERVVVAHEADAVRFLPSFRDERRAVDPLRFGGVHVPPATDARDGGAPPLAVAPELDARDGARVRAPRRGAPRGAGQEPGVADLAPETARARARAHAPAGRAAFAADSPPRMRESNHARERATSPACFTRPCAPLPA